MSSWLVTDPTLVKRLQGVAELHPHTLREKIAGKGLRNPDPSLFRIDTDALIPLQGTLLCLDEQSPKGTAGGYGSYVLLLDEALLCLDVEYPIEHPAEVHLIQWEKGVIDRLLEQLAIQSLQFPYVALVCMDGQIDGLPLPTAQAALDYLRQRSLDWDSDTHPGLDRRIATLQELSEIYADGRDPEEYWVGIGQLNLTELPPTWKRPMTTATVSDLLKEVRAELLDIQRCSNGSAANVGTKIALEQCVQSALVRLGELSKALTGFDLAPSSSAMGQQETEALKPFAHYVATHDNGTFTAPLLVGYKQRHTMDDRQLAAYLGCSETDLIHLAICGRPRPDQFEHDVVRIATHVHAQAEPLRALYQEMMVSAVCSVPTARPRETLTHHFGWSHPLLEQGETASLKFAAWSEDVRAILAYLPTHAEAIGEIRDGEPAVICGADGTGEPVITRTLVSFNGDAQRHYAGQPFILSLDHLREAQEHSCETSAHPYDLLVMAVLLRLFSYFPEISIFSTGEEEAGWTDWSEAAQLCVCLFDQSTYPMSLICHAAA